MDKNKISFFESENNLKNLLNKKNIGRLKPQHKEIRIKAINDYFSFVKGGGYTIKSLIRLVENGTDDHKRRKIKKFLLLHPNIKFKEILQEDKPKKQDYAQRTFICEYSYNKWGEVATNGRYEDVIKTRYRYPRRYMGIAYISD